MTNESTIRILGFAGSLRSASYNRGLLRAAVETASEGIDIETFDLAPVPLFDQDVEDRGDPAPVTALKRAIEEADGLLIACPEYNYGMPGVLKNAIDWASRRGERERSVLAGKPTALMGATPGGFGTVRSQLQVRQALLGTATPVLERPLLHVSRARETFDEEGRLIDDEIRARVAALVSALAERIDGRGTDPPVGGTSTAS